MCYHINIIILYKYLARGHVIKTLMYLVVPNKSLLWKKNRNGELYLAITKIRDEKDKKTRKGVKFALCRLHHCHI